MRILQDKTSQDLKKVVPLFLAKEYLNICQNMNCQNLSIFVFLLFEILGFITIRVIILSCCSFSFLKSYVAIWLVTIWVLGCVTRWILRFVTIWVFMFGTIWVELRCYLSLIFLSLFKFEFEICHSLIFFSFMIFLVLEFCQNLSF